MNMLRSILLLGTVTCAILVPIFAGHALAAHSPSAAILAAVVAGAAFALGGIQAWLAADRRAGLES